MKGVTHAPSIRLQKLECFWRDMAEPAYQALLKCGSLEGLDKDQEYTLIQTMIELLTNTDDPSLHRMMHDKIWCLEPDLARELLVLVGRDVLEVVENKHIERIGLVAADGIVMHFLDYERQGVTIGLSDAAPAEMRLFVSRRRAVHSFESDRAGRVDDKRGSEMIASLFSLCFGNASALSERPAVPFEREQMTLLCHEELERFFSMITGETPRGLAVMRALGKRIFQVCVEMKMGTLPLSALHYLFVYLCDQGSEHGGNHLCSMLDQLEGELARKYEVYQRAQDADTPGTDHDTGSD